MPILNQVCHCLSCIFYLTLENYVSMFHSLEPVFLLNLNDGLLMIVPQVLYHLVCKLLPNMWKRHVSAMPPKVFSFWLLT